MSKYYKNSYYDDEEDDFGPTKKNKKDDFSLKPISFGKKEEVCEDEECCEGDLGNSEECPKECHGE